MATKQKTKAKYNVAQCAAKYRRVAKTAEVARVELDSCVRRASEAGMSYRDIAERIGMSLGWVQASMARSDPSRG